MTTKAIKSAPKLRATGLHTGSISATDCPMNDDKDKFKSTRKRNRPAQPLITSFQADPDVKAMLKRFKEAGGNISEITNAALRAYGPEQAKLIAEEFRKKAEDIEKSISSGKR